MRGGEGGCQYRGCGEIMFSLAAVFSDQEMQLHVSLFACPLDSSKRLQAFLYLPYPRGVRLETSGGLSGNKGTTKSMGPFAIISIFFYFSACILSVWVLVLVLKNNPSCSSRYLCPRPPKTGEAGRQKPPLTRNQQGACWVKLENRTPTSNPVNYKKG